MSAPRPSLLLGLVLVVVIGIYLPTLSAPFLWDDRHLVLNSERVRELAPLWDYFRLPFWSGAENGPTVSIHYRPLTILSLALDFRLHGENPGGFHLTNLILHAVNVALVFVLARRRGANGVAAAIAAAVFGLLPRLAEAAAWISGRTDLLAALFSLSALLVWRADSTARRWLAALSVLIGLFAKEVAFAGLVALAVLAVCEPAAAPLVRRLRRLVPLAVVLVVYAALRVSATLDAPSVPLPVGARALAFFEAIGRYAVMVANPFQPRTQIGHVLSAAPGFVALGVAVLGAAVSAVIRFGRRWSASDWSLLALGGVAIGLVLHAIPLSISVVAADRFLYVPAAALAVLAAPHLGALLSARPAALALAVLLLVGLGYRTSERVADFSNEARFWHDALRTTPAENSLPAVELGGVYYRAALYRQALALYQRAAKSGDVDPSSALANTAICLGWLGRYDEARRLIRQTIAEHPNVPKFWLDQALIELHDLKFEAALSAATRALELHPGYTQAREVRALASELAADPARRAGAPRADDWAARYTQARFLTRAGRYPDAVAAWQALLAIPGVGAEAEHAAWEYSIRFAEPERLRALLGERRPPPSLEEPLAARLELIRELEESWRAAGLALTGASSVASSP